MRDVSRRGIAAGRSGLGLLLLALLFALLLALLIAAGVGCSHDEPRRPNILLVIVDTLRADHVGSYGYSRDTTPAMDLFAQGAVRFERAYATAPWTQPSVASILTGLEPGRHGLRSFGALPSEVVTLAEQLRDHGYETAAIVSHVLLARRFGFDQGFATFLVASALPAHERISTEAVTRNALTLLESFAKRSPSREPFFLLVHYFDPHYRYRAHDDADFAAPSAGRLGGGEEIDVLRDLMKDASDEEIGFVVDLYDEEIKHTDAGVGRLLAALTRMGLDPNTLVVITSDHGEELLERGWLGHTRTLYEELVRVPLIVRPPGESRPGRVVDRPVSLTALAATMLDFAEVPEAVTGLRAADSLRPLLVVPSTVPSTVPVTVPATVPPVFIEVDFRSEGETTRAGDISKNTLKKAIVLGDMKLIRDDPTGRYELYDLAEDPLEQRDISSRRPELVAELASMLEQRLSEYRLVVPESGPIDLSESERRELQALGYLEPDPKP